MCKNTPCCSQKNNEYSCDIQIKFKENNNKPIDIIWKGKNDLKDGSKIQIMYKKKDPSKVTTKITNWLPISLICIFIPILCIIYIWYYYFYMKPSPYSITALPAQNVYTTFVSSKRRL